MGPIFVVKDGVLQNTSLNQPAPSFPSVEPQRPAQAQQPAPTEVRKHYDGSAPDDGPDDQGVFGTPSSGARAPKGGFLDD